MNRLRVVDVGWCYSWRVIPRVDVLFPLPFASIVPPFAPGFGVGYLHGTGTSSYCFVCLSVCSLFIRLLVCLALLAGWLVMVLLFYFTC